MRRRTWLGLGIVGALAMAWTATDGRIDADPTPEASFAPAAGCPAAPTVALDEDRPAEAALLAGADAPSDESGPPPHGALRTVVEGRKPGAPETPIARALREVDDCQARYEEIRDYVCTFSKRERIDGRLNTPHVMVMKARTRPRSVYLKFRQPAAGREAIFVEGRHDGKVLAHDVGLGRLIAGTLYLDPTGSRAMQDCRHPITEAGIGPLLNTLETRWTAELDSIETDVQFLHDQMVDSRSCTRIQVTHSRKSPDFMFYRVRVYIDKKLGLPILFEAYDWPAKPGGEPELVEEYHYSDLKLDVGLSDMDFDIANEDYAFGRF